MAGPDPSLLLQPANAILQAASKAGVGVDDIDLFEINEAFAVVGLASADELGIDDDKLNVNGGAIALGHPVGMSGTRLALTALLELRRRGGGLAAVALCGGGGQGDALIVRSVRLASERRQEHPEDLGGVGGDVAPAPRRQPEHRQPAGGEAARQRGRRLGRDRSDQRLERRVVADRP